ncbi:MAG TPA: pitrilysin family protein, partial [Anaerolineales bacterium]|nr:pitrilysin family protein [Anaerolineales bacterium]
MLKEIHTAPIISHWVWYHAGSRNELAGITGISHWVEHMQFKGSERFPGRGLDREIARFGGFWNAFTYLDWTAYFETLPADKIDLALQLEADRMVNSLFTPEDVEAERTVIISERQGHENEPMFQLSEQTQAAAFRVHAYHHEVIGDQADLETLTQADLFAYYRKFYAPNNAVLAIAGDFDTPTMLARIGELYGNIPSNEPPFVRVRPEPIQRGERRVTVEGPGETVYVEAAYHAPAATQADFYPLTVLDSLLSGPSSLNMFGGGISNKTSRLYRALVEKELAVSIGGGLPATIDPYLYRINAIVHPERTAEEVIQALDKQINVVQETPPGITEIARAIKQARALFAYGSESITNQAFWLGFSEMYASYDWFLNYLDNLARVTPE